MAEQRRRRASVQDYILKGPRPETWSATHKAYSGTSLEASKGGEGSGQGDSESVYRCLRAN